MRNIKKNIGRGSILTALVPKKPVALSIGSINVDQKVGENPSVEDKNKSLTYKIQENANEVSSREKIESVNLAPTIGDPDNEQLQMSTLVSKLKVTVCRNYLRELSLCQLHHLGAIFCP